MEKNYDILQDAISQYECGEYEQAIKTAGSAAGDKEYEFTYNELTGHCYYELGQYSNAAVFYEKAIALNTSNVELEGRLGAAYDLSGKPKQAFVVFSRLYKTHPGNAARAYQLGYHLLGQKKHRKALAYLREAHQLNAGVHSDIHFQIGVCYHNLNEWENALASLKKQADVKDGIADCYHLMGNCYRNLYEDEKAIAAYSQAIWYNENHDDAYWQRFLTKKDIGDYDGAESDIRRALSINPNRLTLTDKNGNPLSIVKININRTNGNVDFMVNEEK